MYENLINESVKISHARKESRIGEEFKSVEIFQTTKRIFIFQKFRNFMYLVAMSSIFSGTIMTFIVLNTLTLALDSYPVDIQ